MCGRGEVQYTTLHVSFTTIHVSKEQSCNVVRLTCIVVGLSCSVVANVQRCEFIVQVVTLIQPTNLVKRKPVGFLTNNPKLTWSLYFIWIQPIRSNDDVHHVSQSVMTGFFLYSMIFYYHTRHLEDNA